MRFRPRCNPLRDRSTADAPPHVHGLQCRMEIMSPRTTDDQVLALIAESILDASEDEILRVATERGVDVVALERKVRAMIVDRTSAADASERLSFSVGETVA